MQYLFCEEIFTIEHHQSQDRGLMEFIFHCHWCFAISHVHVKYNVPLNASIKSSLCFNRFIFFIPHSNFVTNDNFLYKSISGGVAAGVNSIRNEIIKSSSNSSGNSLL